MLTAESRFCMEPGDERIVLSGLVAVMFTAESRFRMEPGDERIVLSGLVAVMFTASLASVWCLVMNVSCSVG